MEVALPLGIGGVAIGISLASIVALFFGVSAGVSVARNTELSSSAKAMWFLAIVLFPIVGSMVYFAVRSDW